MQVDDVRLALQRATDPVRLSALHFFVATPDVWQQPPETLRDRLVDVAEVVSSALESIIEHHVATARPLVIAGDGVLPELARREGVRAIFLYERDEAEIARTMRARARGFDERSQREQRAQVRLNRAFGEWLRGRAERSGIPPVEARPRDTLLERALAVIGS